jgi:protein pelota
MILYKNEEIETRKKYNLSLVKSVKEGGGKALMYSSMHVSTPQLAQLTGVAAILRFPLPGLQDMDDIDDHV